MNESLQLPVDLPLELDWKYRDDAKEDPEARRTEVRARLHKRYPYLNHQQIDLVGVLDDAIDHSVPKIHLPRLRIQKFEEPLTWRGFFVAIRLPLLVYLVTVSVGIAAALLNNSDLLKFYPYAITIVTFLASVPSIKGRCDRYYTMASSLLGKAKKKVEPAIDGLEQRATNLVSLARSKLDQFLSSIKNELNQARKAKAILKQVNYQDADKIPDGSDLEGYLDQSESQVRVSIDKAKSTLNVDQYVPWTLRTQRRFTCCVVLPILLVLLGIQMCATWWTGEALEPTENKWDPVIVSSQAFLIALAETAFSFFVTRGKRAVDFVNRKIGTMDRNANRMLRNKVGDTFHSVLDRAMMHVRERVLQIVEALNQIRGVGIEVQGAAHGVQDGALKASGAVLDMENAIGGATQVETHAVSNWMQHVTDALRTVVEGIDNCTAGLIDCTDYVTSSAEPPVETKSSGKRQVRL